MVDAELARVAYKAYGETTDFKNFRGEPMPEWDRLGERIQAAWISAATAVAQAAAPSSLPSGSLVLEPTPDGSLMIHRTDDSIAVSVALLRQLTERYPAGITRRHGLILLTGINPDGQPKMVAYREVGFTPTSDPPANEGGFLLLQRES